MKLYRVLFDDIFNVYTNEKVKLNHIYEKDNDYYKIDKEIEYD